MTRICPRGPARRDRIRDRLATIRREAAWWWALATWRDR